MTNQPNQQELRERYRQSRAKSLALFAAIDARRRAESRAADLDTAPQSRIPDDDQILRRDIETDIDPLEQWRRDSDAVTAARERETRARRRAEAKMTHEARQRSDVIATLRADVDQVGANLVDATHAVGVMGEAIAGRCDDMAAAIQSLRERLIASETRCEQFEKQDRERQTASATREREMAITLANLRSEICDLRVELRSAAIVGTAPATSTREVN
jgi:hypothetical protein